MAGQYVAEGSDALEEGGHGFYPPRRDATNLSGTARTDCRSGQGWCQGGQLIGIYDMAYIAFGSHYVGKSPKRTVPHPRVGPPWHPLQSSPM